MNFTHKFFYTATILLIVSGCALAPPSPEIVNDSDKYGISIRYNAYDWVPTLTENAKLIAIDHCQRHGKEALYISGDAIGYTTEELHKFRCVSKKPSVDYAGENSISILHDNSSYGSTINAEVLDLAIKHCETFGKGMKHISSSSVKESTEDLHTFMCSNDFTDQRIELEIK
jgi:hypothetical protein